ncbi:MAG: hypothetical protein JJT89_14115 [Nitriliruptoraceae bacterium]|nr:hypothetical protein [Nitriliruptoraceae bacterium]
MVPLDLELGVAAGHRLTLLSLECWDGWADLRFARVDVGATSRLTRRVPPAEAWRVRADGHDLDVFDAVGRGDRAFSNGEVRLVPSPAPGARLEVAVRVTPDSEPLVGRVTLPADPA